MGIWFGIANGQSLTKFSAHDTCIFSFPDNNLSKCQWIFTKLGVCIGIVEIRFGIANHANGQISSVFDSYLPATHLYFCFRTINFSISQLIFTKLIGAVIWRSSLGLLMGKLHQFLTQLSVHILFSVYVHVWLLLFLCAINYMYIYVC